MNINSVNFTSGNKFFNSVQKSNRKNPSFQGSLGDEYINRIKQGEDVTTEEIGDKVNGLFGIKRDTFNDIMYSFITKIKQLSIKNQSLANDLCDAEDKILELEKEKLLIKFDTMAKLNKDYKKIIAEKDAEIEELKQQLLEK